MKSLLGVALIALALSGCASIVSGTSQVLSVKTIVNGDEVEKCNCTLSNNKGTWFVTTPGTVTVHRSYESISVICKKDGLDAGSLMVNSSIKGMAFGNLLFGGVIGAGVDMSSGAAYDYPQLLTVELKSQTQSLAKE